MNAMIFVLLVFFIAFIFYGLIPGIGAFTARAQWRNFRKRIIEVSLFPFVNYSDFSKEDKFAGNYRVFGNLEAIQGKNQIWIDNGSFTVEVDLEGVTIYLLPSYSFQNRAMPFEKPEETLPDEEPKSVLWKRIFSLPAGTKIFVGGPLFCEQGRGVFRSKPKEPLVVVIYDGDKKTILLRSIWAGRQKNEYWNRYTLASLLTGSLSLLLTAYIFLRTPILRLPSLFALTLSTFPIAALLPPGVLFYFLYNYYWKRARILRAERDLLRLPIRYFKNGSDESLKDRGIIRLPTGEPYMVTHRTGPLIEGDLIIRGSSLVKKPESQKGNYYIFGAYSRSVNEIISEPEDPMAELVLIMGNPVKLAQGCSSKAKVFELISALLIFSGISINLFIIMLILHNLIR